MSPGLLVSCDNCASYAALSIASGTYRKLASRYACLYLNDGIDEC